MARILIADDDADYRGIFRTSMEVLGHDVVEVASGAEASAALAKGDVDAVFLDMVMPEGGAISILHDLRRTDPDIPAVIITGRPELINSPILTNGLRMANAKMLKSASLSELDRLVRRLLGAAG